MNQFDLLKSHIDAYTRKDGAVVGAHDDKRQAASRDAIQESGKATRATQGAFPTMRAGGEIPPTNSHEHAALRHVGAANLHEKAAKMFQEAIASGENTKSNKEMAGFHAQQEEHHRSHARTHNTMHASHPYKPGGK